MGFGGIENSLAVAFDIWPNPGLDQVAVCYIDHTLPSYQQELGTLRHNTTKILIQRVVVQIASDQVKFQSRGRNGNDGLVDGLLGLPKAIPLAG